MTQRFLPLRLLGGRLLLCGLLWGGAIEAVAQVTITPAGDEPLVQIDPRAPDNGVNIRRAPGNPDGDTFCAQLWLLSERGFFAEAAKGRPLAFAPVRVVPRTRAFFAAIFFGNAAGSGAAAPNVSYDISVRRPDGTLYSEKLGLVGSGAASVPPATTPKPPPPPAGRGAATPAPPRAAVSEGEPAAGVGGALSSAGSASTGAPSPPLRLGRDYLGIVIEASDPAGLYTVEAAVRDNVGRVELKLKTDFLVEAAPLPAAAPSPTP